MTTLFRSVAVPITLIALFTFFTLPGHTYLQSDTQIYVPMMEHIWNPATYPGDIVATKPHLAYTIYDEAAAFLRWATHSSFEAVLMAQQIVFRALQISGIYLLATAIPLSRPKALLLAALTSLGATIVGPAVLLIEYEPVPRGFAVSLIFLAIGLAATGRLVWASTAASLAFLYHAPTTIPFWLCFAAIAVRRREWKPALPLAAAVILIAIAAHFQHGITEHQHFLARLDPELERLQRLRARYNWISTWSPAWLLQYAGLWLLSLLAYRRTRPQRGRTFLIGLPILGLLSVPFSYLLLERLKWALIPQIQPARALLFVTAMALILCAAAALKATRRFEAALWLLPVLIIPMLRTMPRPLETPDLTNLIRFAREHTSPDAMFHFGDIGRGLQPGIFRARALRSVYVDWKAGGQVNYYRSLADEWWRRWNEPNLQGIDYLVLTQPTGQPSVFHNKTYTVYRLTAK